MLAADEMGHKGVRAMTPLDGTLANALRVKLGKGRELPEEAKPKRPARTKATPSGEGEAVAEKPAARTRQKKTDEAGAPVELKPAATIVSPKPPQPAPEPPEPRRVEPAREAAAAAAQGRGPAAHLAPAAGAVARDAAVAVETPAAEVKRELIRLPESVTVAELAEKMRRKSGEVIKALLELGVMATVNELLDPTAAKLVADKFGFDMEIRSVEGEVVEEDEVDPSQLALRPPVVTVM